MPAYSILKERFIRIFDSFLNLYFVFFISLFFTNYSFLFSKLHNNFGFPLEDISNLSIQAIILSFLLLARYLLDKKSLLHIKFIGVIKKIFKLPDRVILTSIFIIFLIIFLSISIVRHKALSTGWDLTVADQAIYNTTKGDILFSSIDGNINHLGSHFEIILFLIVPLYILWPDVSVLMFLKSFSLALAIFPLYLIAKNRLKQRSLVFAFVFAYFFSRAVRGIGFLDFHTECFIVPLILWSFFFLVTQRIKLYILTLFVLLFCKENAAFLIIAFGLFTSFIEKRYRLGLGLLFTGIGFWILTTNFLMPRFANIQDYPYLTWLPFGQTYRENLVAIIRNPVLLGKLFLSKEKIEFYFKLFGPIGFLSFLSPGHLLLLIPPLLTQLVGSVKHTGMQTISSHYPAHTIPFIFISAIYGAGWLGDWLSKKRPKVNIIFYLSLYIIIVSLLFFGKSDGHKFDKFIKGAKQIRAREKISYLKLIPDAASVTTIHNLGPHLSHRKFLYIWQDSENRKFITKYIVLDRELFGLEEGDFVSISTELSRMGYKNIFSDEQNSFHIYFNPKIRDYLLEGQTGKIISFEDG